MHKCKTSESMLNFLLQVNNLENKTNREVNSNLHVNLAPVPEIKEETAGTVNKFRNNCDFNFYAMSK